MLTDAVVSNVLNGQPYAANNMVTPPASPSKTTTVALTRLRKRDLDAAQATDSPFKNAVQTAYGNSPLSQKAIRFKRENNLTAGRNVSIVLFNSPRRNRLAYTIAATSGPPGTTPHAELAAVDQVPPHVRKRSDNILRVYSERKPCTRRSHCHRKLKLAISKDTEVRFSVDHSPDSKVQRTTEASFQGLQESLGIRVARRKRVK